MSWRNPNSSFCVLLLVGLIRFLFLSRPPVLFVICHSSILVHRSSSRKEICGLSGCLAFHICFCSRDWRLGERVHLGGVRVTCMISYGASTNGVVVSQRGSGKMGHACKLQVPAFLLIQVCHMRPLGVGISTTAESIGEFWIAKLESGT